MQRSVRKESLDALRESSMSLGVDILAVPLATSNEIIRKINPS
jgi:hypothetical protein